MSSPGDLDLIGRKIAFVDIDGTLVNNDLVCPPSAVEAIGAARNNGHLVYICSGRQRPTISDDILGIGFDGIVSSSGARIESKGEVIYRSAMDPAVVQKVAAYLDERHVPYHLESADGLMGNAAMRDQVKRLRKDVAGPAIVKRLDDRLAVLESNRHAIPVDVTKIVFLYTNIVDEAFVERTAAVFAADCDLFRMYMPFLGGRGGEISTKGIHKGFALRFVAQHYGIDTANTVAIGDSDNDSKMLEAAGISIAMGNGDAALKAIADYVTVDIDHGGLAKAFEYAGLV
jgi:Cof subfamily protein (haloacid dehalogenase superfamily)